MATGGQPKMILIIPGELLLLSELPRNMAIEQFVHSSEKGDSKDFIL